MSQLPNPSPNLRDLSAADVGVMAALHKEAFAETQRWDIAAINSLLAQPTTHSIGIIINNAMVGFIMASFVAGESEILTIAIAPAQQRKGYARLLMEYFIEQHQPQKIFLEVSETNTPAIALYQSLGFQIISKRPNYYAVQNGTQKQMVDALVLAKQLIT